MSAQVLAALRLLSGLAADELGRQSRHSAIRMHEDGGAESASAQLMLLLISMLTFSSTTSRGGVDYRRRDQHS
jgi:hypothetical protein